MIQYVIDAMSLGGLYALFALGVALIFGVMGFSNFAHGELIMAGGYALVLIPLPTLPRIALSISLVIGLALLMDCLAFRPVRNASAETLLVTSFTLSFLLQNVAALIWGSAPRTTNFATGLNDFITIGDTRIEKLNLLTVTVTLVVLAIISLFLQKTVLGTQMRAAAEDFRMARLLGIHANTVIAFAFGLSGLLAAAASILLTARTSSVYPAEGAGIVLIAFIATVIGGMGSLLGAVVGGFAIGVATVALQAYLPLGLRAYRDAFVFGMVLVVLVVRPQGLISVRSKMARDVKASHFGLISTKRFSAIRSPWASRVRAWPSPSRPVRLTLSEIAFPPLGLITLICLVAIPGWIWGSDALGRTIVGILINLILVIGLHVFVGLSGIFSFGHAAFMAIGAYTGAMLTLPSVTKRVILPDLPEVLVNVHTSPTTAVFVAGGVAGALSLLLALPLARLSGLPAGLATFAVLVIVNIVGKNWQQVTHGTAGISGIPVNTTFGAALAWTLFTLISAWVFQNSRIGLSLRATRESEDAAHSLGLRVNRERATAFVLSAFFVGIGGALFGMLIGSFNPDAFFLAITFLIVTIIVVGGMGSLSGAVVGTLAVTTISESLGRVERGWNLGFTELTAPPGFREVGLALVMLAFLIFRPQGITAGVEFFRRTLRSTADSSDSPH
ncbi:ABC transporter permease [Streptomyces sp. NPDC055109]